MDLCVRLAVLFPKTARDVTILKVSPLGLVTLASQYANCISVRETEA